MPAITQAFVLGAGLGTRLRPLTDDLPKPLVPIFQKRLITFAFDHLIALGIPKFIVNTHHRAESFAEIFPESTYGNRPIEFWHEPVLLETAGGIANIAHTLRDEPLLVYNADILTDLPIERLIEHHFRAGNIVTLALRSGGGPQDIAFDTSSGRIIGVRNQIGPDEPEFVFTGVYIVERKFIDRVERGVKRSVIPHFVELIRAQEKIGGLVIDDGQWWDVGNREAYLQLHRQLPGIKFPEYSVSDPNWRQPVHSTAIVDPTAQLRGCSTVGPECRVGAGAILQDTIVWGSAQIASQSELTGCIVRSRKTAAGIHRNTDI